MAKIKSWGVESYAFPAALSFRRPSWEFYKYVVYAEIPFSR